MILFALGIISGILLSFLLVIVHAIYGQKAIKTIEKYTQKQQSVEIVSPRDILEEIVPDNYEYKTDRRENIL